MKNYILQTFDKRYLNKDLEWCAEIAPEQLFVAEHQDIALNQLIELNAKDIDLRATVICLGEQGLNPLFPAQKILTAA